MHSPADYCACIAWDYRPRRLRTRTSTRGRGERQPRGSTRRLGSANFHFREQTRPVTERIMFQSSHVRRYDVVRQILRCTVKQGCLIPVQRGVKRAIMEDMLAQELDHTPHSRTARKSRSSIGPRGMQRSVRSTCRRSEQLASSGARVHRNRATSLVCRVMFTCKHGMALSTGQIQLDHGCSRLALNDPLCVPVYKCLDTALQLLGVRCLRKRKEVLSYICTLQP